MSYQERLYQRDQNCHGITDWLWIKNETGVWEGPNSNWAAHIELWMKQVKQKRVIVQAGGACGMYPRLFSQLFNTVYTFEPDPLNFHCLVNNCQADNVIKINAALGDCHKMIELERPAPTNVGMHKVAPQKTGIIPQLMIDDLELPCCDMIQLDVESYEIHVLHGAKNTIEKHRPVISCENGNKEIESFLGSFGYRIIGVTHMDTCYIPD